MKKTKIAQNVVYAASLITRNTISIKPNYRVQNTDKHSVNTHTHKTVINLRKC